MKLSGNKNTSILLLVLLVAALLFAVYYYMVLPKKDRVTSLESSVTSLQGEITSLQEQVSTANNQENPLDDTNIFTLRQKLPQTREIDQLLLNLEEIEFVSKTRIVSVGFNSYDELVSESTIVPVSEEEVVTDGTTEGETPAEGETAVPEEGTVPEEGATDETGEAVETPETPVSDIAAQTLPPELKLITFNLEVAAPEHRNLQKFIEEVEKLERVMHIDSVSYSLPGEAVEIMEDSNETLNSSIQLTTFYYEGEQ